MNRLYWVRHGESEVNLTKEFSHRLVDRPLTPKGLLQAHQTAGYFADKEVSAVYCSPLKRAVETAQVIANRLNLPVTPLECFREIDDGILETQPPSRENWALFLSVMGAWQQENLRAAFPGGEDYITLLARMKMGLNFLAESHPGLPLLVVGHGGSFSATLPSWCESADSSNGKPVDNCAITEIEMVKVNGDLRGRLVGWASVSHLHGQAAQTVSGLPDEFAARLEG